MFQFIYFKKWKGARQRIVLLTIGGKNCEISNKLYEKLNENGKPGPKELTCKDLCSLKYLDINGR